MSRLRRLGIATAGLTGVALSVIAPAPSGSAAPPSSVDALKQVKINAPFPRANGSFGAAVAIDGDTAVVGEPSGDGGAVRSGAAWVYVKSNGTWVLQAKLSDPGSKLFDAFGQSVGISGDTIVVGAANAEVTGGTGGVAYVFTRSGASWTERAQLSTTDGPVPQFGDSVAIEGGTIVVGAPGLDLRSDRDTNSGAVYVYVGSGAAWDQQARLVSDDGIHDEIGRRVEIEGDTIVAGAPRDDAAGGIKTGAIYVFVRTGSTWARQDKVISNDPVDEISFGSWLDLDDDTLATTSDAVPGKPAQAYVYVRSGGQWTLQAEPKPLNLSVTLGEAVAVNGDLLLAGFIDGGSPRCVNCGATYVFRRSGASWTQQAVIVPAQGSTGGWFGSELDFDGVTALIGAEMTKVPGPGGKPTTAGAAYFVTR